VADLPEWFLNPRVISGTRGNSGILGVAEIPARFDFYGSMAHFEREFLGRALRRFGGASERPPGSSA